jgi:hypothetical protein
VPTSAKHGYISVEKEGVTCSAIDNRTINQLKYIAPKIVKTGPKKFEMIQGKKTEMERATKTIPKKWLGYSNASKEYIELADTWVCQNFEEPYLRQVVCSTGKQNPFIQVPPGDNKSHTNFQPTTGPQIRYNQEHGERTCMVYLMASALFTYGYKDVASALYNTRNQFVHDKNGFHCLCTAMVKYSRDLNQNTKGRNLLKDLNQFRMEKNKPTNFLGDSIEGLYLARLLGGDGMEDHCVAITQNWIFDSNFKNALPRTSASLDLCCSSDTVECKCLGFPEIAYFPKVTINK